MTPKEKAEYLFQKYLPYTHNETTEKIKIDTIECALIAVDEVLQSHYVLLTGIKPFTYNYWQEVKEEINRL